MKWLKWILVGCVLLLLTFGVATFFVPKTYDVRRSVVIEAPASLIFSQVVDLEAWQKWNPWNKADPDIQIEYGPERSGLGAEYSWQSEVAGSGTMRIVEVGFPNKVRYELEFEGYENQISISRFLIEEGPERGANTVTWTFEGDVGDSFFGRWSTLVMDAFIGPSYERGLAQLKTRCEELARAAMELGQENS